MKTRTLTFSILLPLAILLSNIVETKAQSGTIDSIKIIPLNPTTNDTVKIISYTTFSSGGCLLTSSSVNITGNNIFINAIHTLGMATVICHSIDTLTIGKLNPGTYTLFYLLSDSLSLYDTLSTVFTVQSITGMKHTNKPDFEIKMYPNPTNGILAIEGALLADSQMKVYAAYGQMVYSSQIQSDKEQVNLSNLSAGLYTIEFLHKDNITRKQFIISK